MPAPQPTLAGVPPGPWLSPDAPPRASMSAEWAAMRRLRVDPVIAVGVKLPEAALMVSQPLSARGRRIAALSSGSFQQLMPR